MRININDRIEDLGLDIELEEHRRSETDGWDVEADAFLKKLMNE